MVAFRQECRAYAKHWVDVQREEFKRLGIVGDWAHPYLTMDFFAEAVIAGELMKFAMNGTLYRGSKPVMWSVVEKTALAEAEVEYQDYQSDMIWVKFPVNKCGSRGHEQATAKTLSHLAKLPAEIRIALWSFGRRRRGQFPAIERSRFSSKISYGLYEVTAAPGGNWAKDRRKLTSGDDAGRRSDESCQGHKLRAESDFSGGAASILTRSAAEDLVRTASSVGGDRRYDFDVPLLDGDHVTDDTGTGFVHTAPGHGADDYQIWMANSRWR